MTDSQQQEDLMNKASNETIRTCDFKIDNLCMVAHLEENRQFFKAIKNMKEYLRENKSFDAEYDKDIGKERVCYSGQVHRGIIKTDGVGVRLVESIKSSLSLNQHTDVLTVELNGRSQKCVQRFPK